MILLFRLNPSVNLPLSFIQPRAVAVESASLLSGCFKSSLGQSVGQVLVYSGLLLVVLDALFQCRLSR